MHKKYNYRQSKIRESLEDKIEYLDELCDEALEERDYARYYLYYNRKTFYISKLKKL